MRRPSEDTKATQDTAPTENEQALSKMGDMGDMGGDMGEMGDMGDMGDMGGGDMSKMSKPKFSFETFVGGGKSGDTRDCMRDIERVRKAHINRPEALLKAYNDLRHRVNKGLESIKKVREVQAKSKAMEKDRRKQTANIQKAGTQQKAQLNNYYTGAKATSDLQANSLGTPSMTFQGTSLK